MQFTWKWNWKNNFRSFLWKLCHVLAIGLLEIAIILNKDSDIQNFLNGDILLNGSWVDLDGTLIWSRGRTVCCCSKREASEDTRHVSNSCVKHEASAIKGQAPPLFTPQSSKFKIKNLQPRQTWRVYESHSKCMNSKEWCFTLWEINT